MGTESKYPWQIILVPVRIPKTDDIDFKCEE